MIPKYGWHLSQMFEAMERGDLSALYVIGENPPPRRRTSNARKLLRNLDILIVQDIFMTRTAEMATSCSRRRTPRSSRGHRDEQ